VMNERRVGSRSIAASLIGAQIKARRLVIRRPIYLRDERE